MLLPVTESGHTLYLSVMRWGDYSSDYNSIAIELRELVAVFAPLMQTYIHVKPAR
jgi:hypothetical protein